MFFKGSISAYQPALAFANKHNKNTLRSVIISLSVLYEELIDKSFEKAYKPALEFANSLNDIYYQVPLYVALIEKGFQRANAPAKKFLTENGDKLKQNFQVPINFD